MTVSILVALVLAATGLRSTWEGLLPDGASAAGRPLIPPGGRLFAGQSLDDAGYTFNVLPDGTLTATSPGGKIIWTGGAPGARGAWLQMGADGDLVERNSAGSVVWHSGTTGAGDCLLGDQTTGRAVVHLPVTPNLWPIWSVAPCYLGDQSKVRAAVVGDSIIFFAKPAIESMLGPRAAYMVSGQVGWTIAEQQAAIITDLDNPEGPPSDWIVNLGTNDALLNNTHWQSDYDAMVAHLSGAPCVLLSTVNTQADIVGHDTIAAQINAAEAATAASHANFHVVDWNGQVHAADHASQWLFSDRIHPNEAGQAALAAMYGRALDRSCHT